MKNNVKTALIILVASLFLISLGITTLINTKTANSEPVRINIPEQPSKEAILDTLQARGVLTSGIQTFIYKLDFKGLNFILRPGSYVIEPQMNEFKLCRKFSNGLQDPIRLTIGKFRTPQQLNEYLNSKLMHNDFDIPLDSFYLIRPNTYEFYWTVTPGKFMERMSDEYDMFWTKKIGQSGEMRVDFIQGSDFFDYSMENIIILASIVEEETNNNTEKPLIASVYINRLERGIPLQADPTVKYAVGDFTLKRILNKHLAVESPFNTYLHKGLPPAPICLPSQASVDAVLEFKETNYIYFCASDKLDGTHRFAATLAEHNQNAARFHKAINKLGIK